MVITRLIRMSFLALLVLSTSATPARAATTDGSFDVSPSHTRAGSAVTINAKCLYEGSATGVVLQVVLDEEIGDTEEQSNDNPAGYEFQQTFMPGSNGAIHASLTIPLNAPPDNYFVYGYCRQNGREFFHKAAPFVVDAPPAPSTSIDNRGAAPAQTGTGAAGRVGARTNTSVGDSSNPAGTPGSVTTLAAQPPKSASRRGGGVLPGVLLAAIVVGAVTAFAYVRNRRRLAS
jgi:hypothetical protein